MWTLDSPAALRVWVLESADVGSNPDSDAFLAVGVQFLHLVNGRVLLPTSTGCGRLNGPMDGASVEAQHTAPVPASTSVPHPSGHFGLLCTAGQCPRAAKGVGPRQEGTVRSRSPQGCGHAPAPRLQPKPAAAEQPTPEQGLHKDSVLGCTREGVTGPGDAGLSVPPPPPPRAPAPGARPPLTCFPKGSGPPLPPPP